MKTDIVPVQILMTNAFYIRSFILLYFLLAKYP